MLSTFSFNMASSNLPLLEHEPYHRLILFMLRCSVFLGLRPWKFLPSERENLPYQKRCSAAELFE